MELSAHMQDYLARKAQGMAKPATIHNPRMSRQAIVTQCRGATNTRGASIRAHAQAGSIHIPYPSGRENTEAAHAAAAIALCDKLGWEGELAQGGLPDGAGYVFVFVNTD